MLWSLKPPRTCLALVDSNMQGMLELLNSRHALATKLRRRRLVKLVVCHAGLKLLVEYETLSY
jgi:hypothetical protein